MRSLRVQTSTASPTAMPTFDQTELDVVSICTHAPWDAPVAIAAAQARIHVLCENPLSVDLQSADQMLTACTAVGVRLAVSHQFRFTPIFRRAKAWITSGRLGEFRSIREVGKGVKPASS